MSISAGTAYRHITPPVGSVIQGAGVDNRAASIRDELEANALYLQRGDAQCLLISCDLACLETAFVDRAKAAIEAATGVPAGCVLIGCTHTHSGPVLIWTNYLKPVDEAYCDALCDHLVAVSEAALANQQHVCVGWAQSQSQIGYNRRVCWAHGSHSMHGDANHPNCTGLEGPDDPDHLALFFENEAGDIVAVLHQNTTHTTNYYGADFFSADFPGQSRTYLRELWPEATILYFNGAFGDISIGIVGTLPWVLAVSQHGTAFAVAEDSDHAPNLDSATGNIFYRCLEAEVTRDQLAEALREFVSQLLVENDHQPEPDLLNQVTQALR